MHSRQGAKKLGNFNAPDLRSSTNLSCCGAMSSGIPDPRRFNGVRTNPRFRKLLNDEMVAERSFRDLVEPRAVQRIHVEDDA